MRITCPNCLAQYEIDGALLPAEGREVQCSACDTIWFQSAPTRKAPKPEGIAPAPAAPADLPTSAPRSWLDDVSDVTLPDEDVGADDTPNDDIPDRGPSVGDRIFQEPARGRARALDPAVTDVLRQEAEFEAAQRKRDADPVEMQPDLGLLGGNPWPAFRDPDEEGNDRDSPADTSATNPANFPDIDDVSATLDPLQASRQSEDGGYDLPMTAQDRQRSFLQGFIIPVALGGLVVGLYMAAPLLSTLIPPAATVLDSFTGAIDDGRAALAQMITGR
jgi:predicted Zn finger-like uncharacterized protein